MIERGALREHLNGLRLMISKIRDYINDKNVSDLDKKLTNIAKRVKSIGEEVEGVKYFFNPSNKMREETKNEFRDWLNKGTREEREERIRMLNSEIRKLSL